MLLGNTSSAAGCGTNISAGTDDWTQETVQWARLRHRHLAKAARQQSSLAPNVTAPASYSAGPYGMNKKSLDDFHCLVGYSS
jgi:hypothetical protein